MSAQSTSESKRSQRKLIQIGSLLIVLALVALGWLPTWIYLLNAIGIDVAQEKKHLGVKVDFDNGWFPLGAAGSFTAMMLGVNTMKQNTIAYAKHTWRPGLSADYAFISKCTNDGRASQEGDIGTLVYIGGTRGFAVRVVGNEGLVIAVPEFDLVISTTDDKFPGDIRKFSSY